jgi:hypothetical protein
MEFFSSAFNTEVGRRSAVPGEISLPVKPLTATPPEAVTSEADTVTEELPMLVREPPSGPEPVPPTRSQLLEYMLASSLKITLPHPP